MIYTFLSDIRNLKEKSRVEKLDTAKLICDNVPSSVREYIEGTKGEDVKICRTGAYNTLFSALRLFFGTADFEIKRGECGKPRLIGADGEFSGIHISLSHSGDMCAVTLSDEGEVGVDIQEQISNNKAQRLKERFFKEISLPKKHPEVEYIFYAADENGKMKLSEMPEVSIIAEKEAQQNFTARWALSEAIMKYDGRGFGAVSDLIELSEKVSAETVKIRLGKKTYIISTVTK